MKHLPLKKGYKTIYNVGVSGKDALSYIEDGILPVKRIISISGR